MYVQVTGGEGGWGGRVSGEGRGVCGGGGVFRDGGNGRGMSESQRRWREE